VERYSLDRQYVNRLPKDDVLAELRRVAAKMGNRRFSRREFDQHAKHCKGSTVLKNFGTWDQALRATGLELAPHQTQWTQITDAQLLDELGRVWRMLGHRPSKGERDLVESNHRQVVVIWRETEGWQKADLERDRKFVAEKKLTEGADEVFVNGDLFILNARALEPVFKARMFAEVQA